MIIKEFLPNPVGVDKDGEYIKIFNDGSENVLLRNWSLKDSSGKTYKLSGFLSPGAELVSPYSETKISLNNNSETIFLYDNVGKLADKLSYSGAAEEGQVIVRQEIMRQAMSGESLRGVINKQNNTAQIFYLDFLVAVILAGLALYVILKIEEKEGVKLF